MLDATLWLDGLQHVTIRGAGMDKTRLNFAQQKSGAEGIKITNGRHITIEGLSVLNSKGDAIKTQAVDTIIFRQVKTEWTRGPHSSNGAYGLYPVQCSHVLIEHCAARGASDAGIYVGQSNHVVVRHCKAWENVAGIEIENTNHADVYANEAYQNTGGLLVFDLPDLPQKQGSYVRLFKNTIRDNNLANFAPKGNIVAKVPQGTGILLLAASHVEIFENTIHNNITLGTGIVSYYITENPITDSAYNPYPNHIYIHHNEYSRPGVRATGKGRMGQMFRFKLRFGKNVPHILHDGIERADAPIVLCVHSNGAAGIVNIDAGNGFKNIQHNEARFDCVGERISGESIVHSP